MTLSELQKLELLEMARAGVKPRVIAKELEVSVPTVYGLMRVHGVLATLAEERNAGVLEDYKDGMKVFDILKKYGIAQYTLYKILSDAEVPLRRDSSRPRKDEATIVELYKGKSTLTQIRKVTGRSVAYIYDVLDRHDVPRRSVSGEWTVVSEE